MNLLFRFFILINYQFQSMMKEKNSKQVLLNSLVKKSNSLQSQLEPAEFEVLETKELKLLESELNELNDSTFGENYFIS